MAAMALIARAGRRGVAVASRSQAQAQVQCRGNGNTMMMMMPARGVGAVRRMGVRKNKYCEEWNNLREDTHKTWTFDSSTTPRAIVAIPVTGLFFYSVFKAENEAVERKAVANGSHANRMIKPLKVLEAM
eukprot:g1481.t1